MLRGRNRLTFHAAPGQHLNAILSHAETRREDLPVAIVLGCHPALGIGALAKVPFDVDEYSCAGALLREPITLVKCVSADMEVPADAEIVLEGKVLLDAREPEGPYDEFTGYAMPADLQPVIEITAITHRENPIYQDIFGGSAEHLLMGAIPKEASLRVRLQGLHPAVRDVHYPNSGCGRVHAVISLGLHRVPEARRVLVSALTLDHFLKHVFVVDDDVDILRDEQVLHAVATCFQGDRDMIVLERMLGSSLDPSAHAGGIAAKVGFDCTRKKADFPPRNRLSDEILERMTPQFYL
jgi:2,5-furandicarboxylate decarboxylase 1